MTSDNNLNPHEEIKSNSKGNYLNIKESMNIFFFFFLTDIKEKYIKQSYSYFITSIIQYLRI